MRLPDPIANTTTEAYLAYKAGVLAKGDLKPKLYEPYIHLDAWLAYWTGLTTTYPVKGVGKNLCNGINEGYWVNSNSTVAGRTNNDNGLAIKVKHNTNYSVSTTTTQTRYRTTFVKTLPGIGSNVMGDSGVARDGQDTSFYRNSRDFDYLIVNATDLSKIQVEEGSTATAYEPYTGEPEMLTDEEAYIAYLSGATDTYPEEFRDPADIRVAGYLRYLISARWGRPEYPVNNEELYLSMLKTQYIPSGDPSSDIVIDGTAKAPFGDVKMYGDTSQTTYTGKNMLTFGSSSLSGNKNGITYSYNAATQEWVLNGTATALADIPYPSGAGIDMHLASGVRYTTTGFYQSGTISNGSIKLFQQDSNHGWQGITVTLSSAANASEGFTPNTDIVLNESHLIRVAAGTVLKDFKVKFQTESGSSVSSYEPFVGGQASPSPEYPQPIQTVTGRQVVTVIGKNLFRAKDGQYKDSTLTVDVENGVIHVYGRQHASYDQNVWIPVEDIHADGTYTLTMNYSGSGGGAFRLTKDKSYQAANNFGGTYYAPNRGTPVTASATNITYNWVLIYLGHGSSLIEVDYYINPQFESGSLSTYFSPYSKNTYPINLGKNLLDMSQTWVRGTLNSSSVEVQPNNNTILSDYIKVEPNTTYVFSQKQLGGKEVKPNVVSFFKDKVNLRTGFIQILNSSPQAFTTSNDTHYIRVGYYNSTGLTLDTWLDYVTDLQLEVGSTATVYAPYFEPIELCKLGTYQDYIWKDGDSWKVHKATGKGIKTGDLSESWSKSNSTANNLFIGLQTDMLKDNSQLNFPVYSDRFLYKNRGTIYAQSIVGITTQTTGAGDQAIRIGLGIDSTTNTVSLFREWLSNNPTTVYYPLATQTETVITNQALISQLDALKQGGAENGTTYIKVSATDPNLPGLLYVEAPKYD